MNPVDVELPAATALPNPLRDPIGVVQRHGRWMLAAFSFGVLLSLLLWSCSEPRYFAEATVVVAPLPYSERIAEPALEEQSSAMTEVLAAEVLSRSNLAKLVAEFSLYAGLQGVETMAEIVERVRSDVTIDALQRLDLAGGGGSERAYSIGFEAETPQVAADVANRLASLFAETSFAGRLEQRQRTTDFLRQELSEAEAKLGERSDAIAEFKERHRGMLPDDLETNLARMKLLDDRRSSLALGIAQAASQVATLSSADDSSPELRLSRLREELRRLRVDRTSRHPDVIELERRVADLEKRLAEKPSERGVKAPQSSLQLSAQTLTVLREQLAATESELNALGETIHKMPAVQVQLEALEERAVILRENRLEVLRKVQSAELGGKLLDTVQSRRVTVLTPAVPPSRPFRTPLRKLALSLVASLGLAVALGIGLELMKPVVISPEDVTSVTGQPLLGWVGRIH